MQMIRCPHCGPREETEFHYGAAAGVAYPDRPADLDDAVEIKRELLKLSDRVAARMRAASCTPPSAPC